MTHPLTDEILEDLEKSLTSSVLGQLVLPSDSELARAASDWQLEQDAEEWKIILNRLEMIPPHDVDSIIEDFKQAMRPQENN